MSEANPEYEDLKRRLDTLASAVEELSKAKTAPEKREAQEDVDSAEAALERYARAHGISLEDAEEAINAVKRNNRKSEIREVLEEIFQEDEANAAAAEAARKAEEDKPKEEEKSKPKAKDEKKPDAVPETDGHWTDRKLFA